MLIRNEPAILQLNFSILILLIFSSVLTQFNLITQDIADLFSFDIGQYLEGEEEEVSSKSAAPISEPIRSQLVEISNRLNVSIDALVENSGPIRTRVNEVQDQLPDELLDALTPAAFLESHRFQVMRARQRMADRISLRSLEDLLQSDKQSAHSEKAKFDELSATSSNIKNRIEELEKQEADLMARLEQTRKDLTSEKQRLADLPKAIEDQKAKLKAAIRQASHRHKNIKPIPGSDADDARIIDEADQIRLRAIAAIQKYLG